MRCICISGVVALTMLATVGAQQARERHESWEAPPEHAAKSNPLVARPSTVAGGAKLYRQRCSTCHGDDGRGTSKAPDLTGPSVQTQSDGALFWKISSGNTHAGMPAFSYLPEPQRWQLVLYLRAIAGESTPPQR